MSIPTFDSALRWLASPRDGPILVLLALAVLALVLGWWSRPPRRP